MSKKCDIELRLMTAAKTGEGILETSDIMDEEAITLALLENALSAMISIKIAMTIELQNAVTILINEINAIKDNASLSDLNTALNVINTLSSAMNPLVNPATHTDRINTSSFMYSRQLVNSPASSNTQETLKNLAKQLEIKGSKWGKVLGAVLIIAGILLSIASFATMVPSFGSSGAGVAVGVTWTLAGLSFFSTSIGAGLEWGYRDTSTAVSTAVENVAKLLPTG